MTKNFQTILSAYDLCAAILIGLTFLGLTLLSNLTYTTVISAVGLFTLVYYLISVVEFLNSCSLEIEKADRDKLVCNILFKVNTFLLFCALASFIYGTVK